MNDLALVAARGFDRPNKVAQPLKSTHNLEDVVDNSITRRQTHRVTFRTQGE